MPGSTVINQRQHVGLQKLSALAGTAHSFLGPVEKYQFIVDEASGESTLAGSCVRVLENLQQTCAVAQLVCEAVRAHHEVYRSGSGCLLFLAGAWSRAALECLHRGISVTHVVTAMSEGMDVCLGVCRGGGVPVDSLMASCRPTAGVSQMLGRRKVKLSRHFCESEKVPTERHHEVTRVTEALSHGCAEAMNLVVEVHRIQSNGNQQDSGRFDATKVLTCLLPGLPEQHAHVSPGCVVLVRADQVAAARHLAGRCLRAALIHGDLSEAYRHLGFKRLTGLRRVRDCLSSDSREEEWAANVTALLLTLDVNLILISGVASENVMQRCCRHGILVVEKVKAAVLSELANASGAALVTYATQLSRHCIGEGVKVEVWRDLQPSEEHPVTAVRISAGGSSALVTAVITGAVHGKLQALEDRFWACAYRLHHALRDRVLLPGAGATEMLCVHHLQKRAQQKMATSAEPHRSDVLNLMADGLVDYISAVMGNAGGVSKVRARTAVNRQLQDYDAGTCSKFSQLDFGEDVAKCLEGKPAEIYDNVSVKQEAWRRALDLVLLVLQTDTEVITRVEQSNRGSRPDLMLL